MSMTDWEMSHVLQLDIHFCPVLIQHLATRQAHGWPNDCTYPYVHSTFIYRPPDLELLSIHQLRIIIKIKFHMRIQ